MKKCIQTWQIIRRFTAQLKRIFESPENACEDTPACPALKFHGKQRIVICNGTPLYLPPLLWNLLVRLSEAPDGHLDFIDSCVDEKQLCPWRNGEATLESSRRCAACRLSNAMWEAGIPYKVIYSQGTNGFSLILLDGNDGILPVVAVSSSEFLTKTQARNVKKLAKTLVFLLPVLQFLEAHDLSGFHDMILPVLSEPPSVKSRQDS